MSARDVFWIAVAVVATAVVASFLQGGDAKVDDRVAQLQTELAASKAEALGWSVGLAEAQEDLVGAYLAFEDSTDLWGTEKANLVQELTALNSRLVSVAEVEATLRGQLVAQGETFQDPEDEVADSVVAELDDGLLTGRVAFFPLTTNFDLIYSARVQGALITTEAPNGSLMITAKAQDPRVDLRISSLEFQAQEPVRSCTLGQRAVAAGVGFLVGGITSAVIP